MSEEIANQNQRVVALANDNARRLNNGPIKTKANTHSWHKARETQVNN